MKAKTEKISIAFKYPLAPEDRRLFGAVPIELWERVFRELSGMEFKLWFFLIGQIDGECHPATEASPSDLAKKTGISERNVIRTLKKLQACGLLEASCKK